MNKFPFSIWSLLIMASIFVATSCKDDDDEPLSPPTITISGTDQLEAVTVNPGQAVGFTVTVNAPGGFSALHITKSGGVATQPLVFNRGEKVENTFSHQFAFSPSIEEAGETIIYTFKALDEAGLEVVKTYSITVSVPVISEFLDVVIGGRYNKSIGNFYSMLDNRVFLHSQAVENKASVDFLFYYNETNKFTIAAPTDAYTNIVYDESLSLEGMNNNTFFVRSSAVYADITTPEQVESAWYTMAQGEPSTLLPNIEVGVVFAFRMDASRGSRIGVAEVLSLENVTPGSRKVTLRIKIMMD